MLLTIKNQLLFLAIVSLFFSCKKEKQTLFTLLDASETGIQFSNRITPTDSLNILNFEYLYNGGGVGIGDLNGDNLPDLYFTGNQVANQLYLNQCDSTNASNSLKFKNVTNVSQTGGNGKWCSGVALVDINADKKLDIYVCANVKKTGAERANLLYINQGNDSNKNPIFKEMAAEYGLADTTFSTNAAFFDYDNDGDLDVYILVDKVSKEAKPTTYKDLTNDGSAPNNDQLYRNDFDAKTGHAHFTNVTKQAGILGEGFGLGLNICDINNDGWKDIYVTNDFITNDFFWINQKNGTFKNQAKDIFKHTSYSAMGNDIADINNDGLPEVLALDMLPEDNFRRQMLMSPINYQNYLNNEAFGFQYQVTRNTLQFNQGLHPKTGFPLFSEVANYMGVAATDWSWCPLVADFDNDGFKDIYITNGFPKDITDHDFMAYKNANGAYGYVNTTLQKIPEVKISNYAFKNVNGQGFEKITNNWGLQKDSFSNGAAYADFDLDGDLDFVVNNINDSAFVYQNNLHQQIEPNQKSFVDIKLTGDEYNTSALGAKIELRLDNGQILFYENSPFRGYLSTVQTTAHFGIPQKAKIVKGIITWPNGIVTEHRLGQLNKTYIFNSVSGKPYIPQKQLINPIFTKEETGIKHFELDHVDYHQQKLLPHKLSESGPCLVKADVNGDGLEDIFMGGSNKVSGKILIQNANGFMLKNLVDTAKIAKNYEETAAVFFDVEGDGDQDLYLATGGNEFEAQNGYYADFLYINDGKGNFTEQKNALPNINEANGSVSVADFDKDGDIDLFVGVRHVPFQYPKSNASYILINQSKGSQIKFIKAPASINQVFTACGMVTGAVWQDLDNDSWPDLVVIGEHTPIQFYKNEKGKSFTLQKTNINQLLGSWQSILPMDIDKDGKMDFVVGNIGQNTLVKAFEKQPYSVYGKDFNVDGYYDAIPTHYLPAQNGEMKEFVYNVREDLIKQLITTKKKYPDFTSFAKDDFAKMFTSDELKDVLKLQTNFQQSIILKNNGNWNFSYTNLPMQAQWSPLNAMLSLDINNDTYLDILVVGNNHGHELFNGRQDASYGSVLMNNKKGNFDFVLPLQANFIVPNDAKSLIALNQNKNTLTVFAAQNRGNLLKFVKN